ncbi:unnamed protein product, partial [Amoebophrya sp. A25]|eukprot:GSA25T00001036001.1
MEDNVPVQILTFLFCFCTFLLWVYDMFVEVPAYKRPLHHPVPDSGVQHAPHSSATTGLYSSSLEQEPVLWRSNYNVAMQTQTSITRTSSSPPFPGAVGYPLRNETIGGSSSSTALFFRGSNDIAAAASAAAVVLANNVSSLFVGPRRDGRGLRNQGDERLAPEESTPTGKRNIEKNVLHDEKIGRQQETRHEEDHGRSRENSTSTEVDTDVVGNNTRRSTTGSASDTSNSGEHTRTWTEPAYFERRSNEAPDTKARAQLLVDDERGPPIQPSTTPLQQAERVGSQQTREEVGPRDDVGLRQATLSSDSQTLGGEDVEIVRPSASEVVAGYFTHRVFGDGVYSQLMGTILSNFAVAMIVPSWLNEKAPDVSVSRTIWFSMSLCTAIYLAVGFLGAAFFEHHITDSANYLTVMIHRTDSFVV